MSIIYYYYYNDINGRVPAQYTMLAMQLAVDGERKGEIRDYGTLGSS